MRKYLFVVLLCFVCSLGYAQSLSFEELLNLTNMTDDQAHNFLLVSRGFRSLGKQMFNGRDFEQFKSNRTDPDKTEIVSLGESGQGTGGNVSRRVFYSTLRVQDVNALLAQAKRSTMHLVFQGADPTKSIYRFDNSLFMSIITISLDKKSGNIQVEEK